MFVLNVFSIFIYLLFYLTFYKEQNFLTDMFTLVTYLKQKNTHNKTNYIKNIEKSNVIVLFKYTKQ